MPGVRALCETSDGTAQPMADGVPTPIACPSYGDIDLGDEPERSGAIRLGDTMPGTRLRVIERLSDGASGVVFRGEHVELGRPVAIKILRRVVQCDADRERFLAEARLATSIDSPHVVDVIDFGQLPDGRLWYAMGLLDGDALADVLEREGRLPLERAFSLLRMACKGLAATHAKGMVHCDVKPQNLVLVQRGRREQLVVVDFGIAHAIGTRPPTICGTPEYISPEQIDRSELDPRTDVYALGCCAYEMLTGRLLVEETTVERAVTRHLEGIEQGLFFPPEAAVPDCVEALVRRCLARDPAKRPASMAELEAALCEAQIHCGIASTREDLELPEVDRVRRDGIAIGFAGLLAPRRRRLAGRAAFGAALSAMAATALTVLALHVDPEPVTRTLEPAPTEAAPPSAAALLAAVTEKPELARPVSRVPTEPTATPVVTLPVASLSEPALLRTTGATATVAAPQRAPARTHRAAPQRKLAAPSRTEQRKAKQVAAREVRRDPASARAHVRLGDALRGLGRSQAAARQYREAARLGSRAAERKLRALARG